METITTLPEQLVARAEPALGRGQTCSRAHRRPASPGGTARPGIPEPIALERWGAWEGKHLTTLMMMMMVMMIVMMMMMMTMLGRRSLLVPYSPWVDPPASSVWRQSRPLPPKRCRHAVGIVGVAGDLDIAAGAPCPSSTTHRSRVGRLRPLPCGDQQPLDSPRE